jgi:hypothetical protein
MQSDVPEGIISETSSWLTAAVQWFVILLYTYLLEFRRPTSS